MQQRVKQWHRQQLQIGRAKVHLQSARQKFEFTIYMEHIMVKNTHPSQLLEIQQNLSGDQAN